MRQGGKPPWSQAGFALVEALASLVIVALIALMLATGVSTGRRVWERLDGGESAGEAIDGAQSTLRDRLEQAFPATLYDLSTPRPDFDGTSSSLEFLSSPPAAARPAAVRRYSLTVDAGGALTLSSASSVGSAGRAVASQEKLLSNVRGLRIDYFGPQAPYGERGWSSAWRGRQTLPEVVRLHVVFGPGDRRHWPDLIVRPHATVDIDCLLNLVTHRCKGRG